MSKAETLTITVTLPTNIVEYLGILATVTGLKNQSEVIQAIVLRQVKEDLTDDINAGAYLVQAGERLGIDPAALHVDDTAGVLSVNTKRA